MIIMAIIRSIRVLSGEQLIESVSIDNEYEYENESISYSYSSFL